MPITNLLLKISFVMFVFSLSSTLLASSKQDIDGADLLEFSLEELLNIRVQVGSYDQQSITEAPLVVSRYSRSKLEKMGIHTLHDMLNFVPGILLQSTQSNNSAIMSRGLVESFNQKILFLLDEVPYWAPSHSSIPLHGIPFDSISHIEVIRGPAAVFYGTNASAAVINVVTVTNARSSLNAQVATNSSNVMAHYGAKTGKSWFTASVEAQNDDGQDAFISGISPSLGLIDEGAFLQSVNKESILLKAKHNDFQIMAHAFDTTYNETGGSVPFVLTDGLNYQGKLVHVNYEALFSNSEFKLFSDYNQFALRIPIRNALAAFGTNGDGGFRFEDKNDNYRTRIGSRLKTRFSNEFSLLLGYEYEYRSTSEYQIFNATDNSTVAPIMAANNNKEQAFFFQSDYQNEQWHLVLGGRYVDNQGSGEHFSPQVSLVYKIASPHSIKLLFSEGFNSPNFIQQSINLGPALQGNPDLSAEKIRTFDLAYTFSESNQLFVANLFYTKANALITRDISTGIIRFNNIGENIRSGFELDYQLIDGNLTLFTNLSYLNQGRSSEDSASFVTPKILSSIGVSYDIDDHHTIGSSINYVSRRANSAKYLTWNLTYQYSTDDYAIYTTIENVTGDKFTSADIQNFSPDLSIVNQDGLNFRIGLKYYFGE